MKPPIFVIGSPRSGTSLLRLMLTCHRNIVIPPECGFALWLYPRYRHWRARDSPSRLGPFLDDLIRCRKFSTWNLDRKDLSDLLGSRRLASYADVVSAVYECFARRDGGQPTRWGDKNNYYLDHIPELKQLFPATRFIHIVRDGRGVACSYRRLQDREIVSKYAPRLPMRLTDIARQWNDNIETINLSFDSISWENVHQLKFEDLISDPQTALREVCRAIEEDYDTGMMSYHKVNRERLLEPREFLQWKENTLSPPIASVATRHERELTTEQRKTFETLAKSALERYGYLA